jgi:hypothetical protein
MKSSAEFTAMLANAYHLPPLLAVAVGSSIRPPSANAAVKLGVILVHWRRCASGRPPAGRWSARSR